ncbi:MAG: UDP-N-acetylmuramoyl-L-alanyl-D-glutamate--2,6-diaminopimelate ligase, partial [Lachnospiraceae bacterium]|nr:UDP-N-acetylmuramoyl-L-alanyl-D-glutamate--2,6-diaminopimelate ligase [Lachnospiraceae bacterium]
LGVFFDTEGLINVHAEIANPGKFSVYNALCAIAVARHFGCTPETIAEALKGARVKGRIEMVPVSDRFTMIIDYAHNAMALTSLLATLRDYRPTRLVCLFGCGGNRARDRRFEMGEVSGKYADFTIITSDNPRNEDPQAIIDDIKQGIAKTEGEFVEIIDRREAIRYAIEHADDGDIIVLAGKGHEDYQEIKGVKYPMDEREIISEIVSSMQA